MNDFDTVRVTFTCAQCGSANELTAAWVHEATVIHCSRCATAIAPLGVLQGNRVPTAPQPGAPELVDA